MSSPEHQQLVEFLGRQFTGIERRFDVIDRRFDVVDRQFTEIRHELLGHFDDIYRRFERLEQEYQAITEALRRIEAGLAGERGRREVLLRDLAELKQHVEALQSRIEEIEQRLGA
jgi:chromosome segregation ATPase